MNPATHEQEGNVVERVLYMAQERHIKARRADDATRSGRTAS